MNQQALSSLIWSVADLLRGDFKQSEYGRVILPFTVLRRLDCVLAPTKVAVLAEHAAKQAAGIAFEPFVRRKAGLEFFNVSPLDMGKLMGDQDNIRANLDGYIQGFAPDVRSIFEHFDFAVAVERLHKAKLLYLVTEKFAGFNLHPSSVDSHQMGLVFEELIRKFAELSNETAGEHFTPREVIRLMVNLQFIEDNDALTKPGVVRTMYDPTAGTGGMLSVAGEYLAELNPKARLTLFGQELNAESHAICKADMLIRGQDISSIIFGNTLSDDGLHGAKFDYMLSNPPFGVEWKKIEKAVRDEHEKQGYNGRDPYTEHSRELNPRLGGQDIRTSFKGGDYQLLLVANKFQTGFDEPLLCAMYVDKRLGGIQAVQTLSLLNRCYPGKDQTYVVDFVNDPADVLAAFKPYYETAELSGVTDPYLVHELKAKLDSQALYDTYEVDRVVNVAIRGKAAKQSELDAATTPVANRLLTAYAEAKKAFESAGDDATSAKAAKDTMDSLILFKSDIATYVRVYGFLSQIFDYGNTDIEKRSIFFRLIHPLLTYGREREGVALSALRLTAYTIKSIGNPKLDLSTGYPTLIKPGDEGGSGQVQDKAKIALDELIEKVNDLFEGDLKPGDKLVYVNDVIKGKLMESEKLAEQAANNTKEQFANSPDLASEIMGAVMDALAAHTAMSKQALESEKLRADMKDVLLGAGKLWEGLREKARGTGAPAA